MEEIKRNFNSEYFKQAIVRSLKKLNLIIRMEEKCSEKEANEKIIYFLKQLIYVIGEKDGS